MEKYNNEKLKLFNQSLIGKKVAIIGLGVSNIPLIDYMNKYKAKVTVFDNKELKDIDRMIIDKLLDYNFDFSFGKDSLKKLKGFDYIFRSPSCLPTREELVSEKNRGAIVTTEIEMVLKLTPSKVIGITGSDGKTTTTTIISEILKEDGHKVFLGGNIGIPLFDKIEEMRPEDIVVLELSSFQLMNMEASPEISIVTNITPNHLNIHKDYEEYIDSKKEIFKHQDRNGLLIINKDNDITREFYKEAIGKYKFFTSKEKLDDGAFYDSDDNKIKLYSEKKCVYSFDTNKMKLIGIHNYENAAAAILSTFDLVKKESIDNVLSSFGGVEHRLELVATTSENVKWYNDSVSSSPTRTIAGLKSFDGGNIILIAGGYDKNLDYEVIGPYIVDKCKALVLLGSTSDKIENAVKSVLKKENKNMPIVRCKSLEEVVQKSNELSKKDDIVLFSPASASFDMFKNFADRGEQFKKEVKKFFGHN